MGAAKRRSRQYTERCNRQGRGGLAGLDAAVSPQDEVREQVVAKTSELSPDQAARGAELAASEARLRTVVEHAPEAIVLFDGASGRFLMANEKAARLYGVGRDALLRLCPWDVSPEFQPDGRRSRDAAREAIQRALDGEMPAFDWTHRHASGRLVPCEVRLVRLPAEGRQLVRGSIFDNTERHRREQVQQAMFGISQAVLEGQDLPSLYARIHEIVGGLLPAHNFYIALLDPATDIISFPYFVDESSPPPEPREITTGLTGEVLRTGKPLLVTRSMEQQKRRVGQAVTIAGVTDLPYLESGRPAAVWLGVPLRFQTRILGVMAVQDYHNENAFGDEEQQVMVFVAEQVALAIEHKRAEEALWQRHQEVVTLLDSLPGYASLKGADGRYRMANRNFCRAVGVSRDAIFGKTDSDLFPRALAAKYRADDERLLASGKTLHVGEEQMTEAGRIFCIETTKVPVKNERGQVEGLFSLGFDISERKRVEEEMLKALAREKELGRLKSDFVSMVSHEFRTPLGIIQSSAEILNDYLDQLEPPERIQHLDSIVGNTQRMARLMEEVLLLGRLEAGKMSYQPAPLRLWPLCHRIADEVQSATQRQCPITLRGADSGLEARADEALLRHILTNLLSNAVKYSSPGSEVDFEVRPEAEQVVFTITDRGIGVPKADQRHLFEAFHRGANVGARPGTGLGLVIVKRCVDLHRGTIHLRSRPGGGTTVIVRLPVFSPKAPP